jgi:hypothetical protein
VSRAGRERSLNQEWLITLVPAFPVLLLVTRLWYLGRQNLSTMLLLVQYVSPLGLFSALLVSLAWVFPAVVLVARLLGTLLRASDPQEGRRARSWLSRASLRIPDWVLVLAVLLATLTWQLRFLPTLLMLTVATIGLLVRERAPGRPRLVRAGALWLPLVAAAVCWAWLVPAGLAGLASGEWLNAALLLVPPVLAVALTGPVPARYARAVTHWPAVTAALLAPFLLGLLFLRAPILPTVALELADPHSPGGVRVVRGQIVTVDDRMTTLLDGGGTPTFVLNDRLLSKTICADFDRPPASTLTVYGWQVEESALRWIAPHRTPRPPDPRCQGRPATPAADNTGR